jgi:hypothetical protein
MSHNRRRSVPTVGSMREVPATQTTTTLLKGRSDFPEILRDECHERLMSARMFDVNSVTAIHPSLCYCIAQSGNAGKQDHSRRWSMQALPHSPHSWPGPFCPRHPSTSRSRSVRSITATVLTAGERYLGIVVAGQMPELVAYRV